MSSAPDMPTTPLPTGSGQPLRIADFGDLLEAVDYAAACRNGISYYNAKGEVTDVLAYADLKPRAEATASRMRALGLDRGDRIALMAETTPDFAVAFVGALYAGLVPAPLPLPVAFGEKEAYYVQLQRIVETAGARAVFVGPEYASWAEAAMEGRGLLHVGALDALPDSDTPVDRPASSADDLAYLQFSSGTTGAPKGVAVTHGAMMANLRAIGQHGIGFEPGWRGFNWLPLYHDMGLVGCFLTPIATQLSADHMATRDFIRRPLMWLELIARNKINVTYAPSFGYDLALRRARGKAPEGLDLSSWRVAGIGGDMIKAPVLRAFEEAFAPAGFRADVFTPSYGMAETTLALSFAPKGQGLATRRLDLKKLEKGELAAPEAGAPARDFALCGPALPEHKIEIRDENGAVLPEERVGRIWAAGPSLMREYFGDPKLTAEAMKDGWLDTGDLGYLTDGQIVITGRAKDLMIINGRNLWPHDLEWTVETEVDAVREGGVAAFSITPDDSEGDPEEKVVVVVECRARDEEARTEIRTAAHAVVRERHGVEALVVLAKNGELPTTSSGKLSRAKARGMYVDGIFDDGATAA